MDKRPAEFIAGLMMARSSPKKHSKKKGYSGGSTAGGKGKNKHRPPFRGGRGKTQGSTGRGSSGPPGAAHGKSYFGGKPGSFSAGKRRALD